MHCISAPVTSSYCKRNQKASVLACYYLEFLLSARSSERAFFRLQKALHLTKKQLRTALLRGLFHIRLTGTIIDTTRC